MPRIENGAPSRLTLVVRYHRRLDLDAAMNQLRQSIDLSRRDPVGRGAEPGEVDPVCDQAMLDGFCQAGPIFSLRKRAQSQRICHDRNRWMKRADQVLS